MVQSISSNDSILAVKLDNNSKITDKDGNPFGAVFSDAQSKLNEKESGAMASSGTASTDNKKSESDEDLIGKFKSACQGLTVCGKCGSMYRGTAVVKCAKCGNDMSQDNDDAKKMQGVGDTSAQAASQASAISKTSSIAGAKV